MIRYRMLRFLLSLQSQASLTSCINAVMLFLSSAQADDRVRVEKRDSAQFEFASAMNTVTEFYCHTQEKGVFVCDVACVFSFQSFTLLLPLVM